MTTPTCLVCEAPIERLFLRPTPLYPMARVLVALCEPCGHSGGVRFDFTKEAA